MFTDEQLQYMNRAIEAYIKKLESENARAKQFFSEVDKVIGFDGSRPNRTVEDIYYEILDLLEYYRLDKNC